MKEDQKNFLTHPTLKTIIWFSVLSLLGTGLLVLALTDLFREPFFSANNAILNFMVITNLGTLFTLWLRYLRQRE